MPRGIFITYVCDVVGSSAVSKKTDMMLACHKHTDENSGRIFIGSRQADFHHIFPEPERFIRFFPQTDHMAGMIHALMCAGAEY